MHADHDYQIKLPNVGAQFKLVAASKNDASISIAGHQYRIVASGQHSNAINELFKNFESKEFKSIEKFEKKLGKITGQKPEIIPIHSLGKEVLLHKPISAKEGDWFKEESIHLPLEREAVAKGCWHKEKVGLLDFLKGEHFDKKIIQKFDDLLSNKTEENEEKFVALFDLFSRNQIDIIEGAEELKIFPWREGVKDLHITEKTMNQIEDYLNAIGSSAVVSLATYANDSNSHTVATSNIIDAHAPFAIHSVGKIFTGLLTILMIQNGVIDRAMLDEPVQLEDHVKETIREKSAVLADHLEKTTLRELMLHQSGIGDYLGNYEDAIEHALNSGLTIPVINKPEDLLKFADDSIEILDVKKGEERYSNLGLLLVGLSVQHLYNEKNKGKYTTYDDLLKQNIFQPAGMNVSLKKPDNGVYNEKEHAVAAHINATPAGGHWTSADDMQAFGKWIFEKVQNEGKEGENTLYQLMETHGAEFYRGGVISHLGGIESASAKFAVFLDNGISVTVMSNREMIKNEFSARQIYYTIDHHLLTKEV